MHLGDITKRDIANEIRDIKTSHQYPEEGWKINGDPTTLQYLAELWAEQENEEQPEDRGTFPFWLETHVDDGRVEEPENRIYEVTVLVTLFFAGRPRPLGRGGTAFLRLILLCA